FEVAPGEIGVLIGRSGAGKSTLLTLLLGQKAPHHGRVLIGGRVPGQRNDLARLIAYAPQSIDLLGGGVRENLSLAAPGASEEAMWAALRLAQIDEAVMRAGGLAAGISAFGDGFSAGESRRLALARAFLSERRILLLDEPTEGLDAETERRVIAAIKAYVAVGGGRLALIVSHRAEIKAIAQIVTDLDSAAS
ncbi:MAG: ATP-binding cassette domain-containing protein, partial [Hyphomonadaceae bacterium]